MKMIFDILKDGLEYVGTNKKQTILYYLAILLLPLVLIESYSYHIIENCLNGMINNKDKLPDITLNPQMIIKGLKLLILKIIYYLPELIIILIVSKVPTNHYIILILLTILTIISYIISQIAGICMIDKKEFKEGFNFTKIIDILKKVGISYLELTLASIIIILGIIGVTIVVSMIIILLGNINSTLFTILSILMIIAYIIFIILVIPAYALFKNRTITSIYNLR